MPGINLAQGAQQQVTQKKEQFSRKGAVSMSLVLVFVLIAWGVLSWYDAALSGEIESLGTEIDSARAGMTGADLDRVADLYFRLQAAGESVVTDSNPTRVLRLLESGVEPDVVFTDVSFDEETGVSVSGIADDFQSVVRQLVSLKRSPDVSSTALRDLSRNDAGRIDFSLSFALVDGGDRG